MGKTDGKFEKANDLLSEIYDKFPDKIEEKDEDRLRTIFSEFVAGFSMMVGKGPFVTVFGSKQVPEERPEYVLGRKLGAQLAKNGFAVLTGGGPGLMEAVNRGAHEANGKSMGVNISLQNEEAPNQYADPVITMKHFFVRKVLLFKYSSAFVFLPGGFGTLDELFETVTLVQSKKIKPFPIILVCRDHWSGLIEWLNKRLIEGGFLCSSDIGLFDFAETAEEVVDIIKRSGKH